MIRRLKKSFVTVTMISAALVLVVLMGIVNLINSIDRARYDREILEYIAENGGSFPGDDSSWSGAPEFSEDIDDGAFSAEPSREGGAENVFFPPQNGRAGWTWRRWDFTVETKYETRYFSVVLDASGALIRANTEQIAAVNQEEAVDIARTVRENGRSDGVYGNYRYTVKEGNDGESLYVFLDCTRSMTEVREFFRNSVIVTFGGLVVLFGLAWLLSGKAVRPMAESYEKQKSFITNAGHELKTPLAVIESSTEVIEIENGDSQWTQSIHGQVRRLSKLTEELVTLSRMDEGGAQLALSETDISQLTEECVEPFARMAEQKGLRFDLDIQPGILWKVNPDAMEKICAIMADNAVKYAAGDILLSLSRDGGHVILREENPAEGLTAGKQEQLFDRFYRGDASRNGAQPGYGLGLPLARSLAEAMGGKMQAHSPDGRRLVITMQLS